MELKGGNSSCGNVFVVNRDGYFGPVCDDDWGELEARIVCRQLGFSTGNRVGHSHFGPVPSKFAMDSIDCSDSAPPLHIQDCAYDTLDDCSAAEGGGVYCT